MPKANATHVIEIAQGAGEPASISLTPGEELTPLSIGKKGTWRIDAAGMLDVHAFVYFDGESLFMQSAESAKAALADGVAVAKTWTELSAPCSIEIAGARLHFRSLADPPPKSHRELAAPPPEKAPSSFGSRTAALAGAPPDPDPRFGAAVPPGTLSLGSVPPDVPMASGIPVPPNTAMLPDVPVPMPAPMIAPPGTPRGMNVPRTPGTPRSLAPGVPMPPNTALMQGAPLAYGPPAAAPDSGGSYLARFKELSLPQKLLVILAPFSLVSAAYLLFDDGGRDPVASRADAGGAVSTVASTASPPIASPPVLTAPAPPVTAQCPPGFVLYSVPINGQLACVPVGTPMPPAPDAGTSTPAPAPVAAARTLERQAVDLVATGNYAAAAQVYEQLLQQNPNNRVYAEASRILRAKADAGVP